MTVGVVIVAGGSGLRAGGEKPKQYQLIGGRPVIWWTLQSFLSHPGIDRVLTVIGTGHDEMFYEAVGDLAVEKPVTGGSTRQESCRAGLEALEHFKLEKVLIHDAARPFASRELISHVIAALDKHRAVIPGMPIAETIKFAPGGIIKSTVDRSGMWTAQTPQGFEYQSILQAHRAAHAAGADSLTDDAAVAEHAGIEIAMVAGRLENRKLTTAEDIIASDRIMNGAQLQNLVDIRVGQGIDFHVFEDGNAVILCGVSIPYSRKLKGHSDADVAMHALTDALLGAIGEGDIGQHFPPSDPQWKGAPSSIFLGKAVSLIEERQGLVANVDITILAEAPRIAPHLTTMKASLSKILKIDPARIAIKATTTEKLGAIGRGEGMAAFATATVRLP